MPTRIINVSNRLPVTVGQTITRSSGGLVAALAGLSRQQFDPIWVGWPGGDIAPERQDEVRTTLSHDHGCLPIFLSADEVAGYYEGFANSSLWPLLHYMPSKFRFEPPWWDHYRSVNRRFAETVLDLAEDGDLVWVHDYQLMLLPSLLRKERPDLRIGFFLHTPFPSYEIFRCHPRREDLLAGLLGADLVGFHTFNYLRHFKSAVLRLLGIESEMTRIRNGDRTTALGIYPIGIDAERFENEMRRPELSQKIGEFDRAYASRRIILSIERLDYSKGILHRLDAIEQFLSRGTRAQDLKFIFIAVPSRENIEEYQLLRDQVERRVGQVNGRFATLTHSPIKFIHASIDFTDMTALYAMADVAVVTPLIDGMNLVAKEFVACQRDIAGKAPGVLVLSEFAGAAEELFSALIVNPYDASAVADAIQQALDMPPGERRRRMTPMVRRVTEFDARAWARAFIDDLAAAQTDRQPSPDLAEPRRRILDALRSQRRIALFLDYDGTLREIVSDPDAATPTPELRALFDRLAQLPNTDVTIISGRTPQDLNRLVGQYPFGLIAEHGAALRPPHSRDWEQLDRNAAYPWKDEVLKVLRLFERSTPGSFVEQKHTGLVWHYRRADPEYGQWKARLLVEELQVLTASEPIQVRQGRKIVEIVPNQLNKGSAVLRLMEGKDYTLILCAGDDATDESMFKLPAPNLITVHVGEGTTQARHHLPSPAALRRFFLETFNAAASAQ